MKKYLFLMTMCVAVEVGVMAAPGSLGRSAMNRQGRTTNQNAQPARGSAKSVPSNIVTRDQNDREKKTGGDFAFNYSAAPLTLLIEDYQSILGKTVIPDPEAEKTLSTPITFQSLEGQKFTDEERILTLEMLLEQRGVHLEPYGEKFVRAVSTAKARKDGIPLVSDDADVTEGGRVVSRFIKLKYVSYDEVQKALEGFRSEKGNFLAFERINTILVTDTELNIARMLEVVKAIDIETPINEQVFVRQIKYASAQDIQQQLQKIVEESQKEQQNAGKGVSNALNQPGNRQPPNNGIRIGHRNQQQPAQQPITPTAQNILANISDADRGMIRGKVLMLADERSNKLVIVTSDSNMTFFDKVIEQLDIETTPDTVIKVYRLKYAEADEVSDMINDLIGNAPSSKNSSKGNQNQTAKSGQNANVTKNTASPAKSQANKRTGEAKTGELSKENTTVLPDKRINGLVVMTSKELVPVIENIIEKMDVKLSQVLIETCIIEVTLGDDIQTGIDWVNNNWTGKDPKVLGGGGAGSSTEALTSMNGGKSDKTFSEWATEARSVLASAGSSYSSGITTADIEKYISAATEYGTGNSLSPATAGISYFLKSDKLNVSAIVAASKADSRANYIASPIVMTVDNKEALIEATETRKFYSGSTSSNGGSTYSSVSYNYTDKDLGIVIKVTPKINPNGTVMLKVQEEYSQTGAGQSVLVSSRGDAPSKETIDTALTRKMSADVILENLQTVVLGGLTEKYTSEKTTGIPILKDIPWIGKWLFGSVAQTENRKELLVFMTPYVLDDGAKAQLEAIRRKRALSNAHAWEDNGWSKSELADPVSAKELLRRQDEDWKKQDEEYDVQKKMEQAREQRAQELLNRYNADMEKSQAQSDERAKVDKEQSKAE